MEKYITNYKNFHETVVYDFKLGVGGIGDYLKFFMIILSDCVNNNKRFYHKMNDLEIQKYIKLKYDVLNIRNEQISKLNNFIIRKPNQYYGKSHFNYKFNLDEIFIFDNKIKKNVKNILPNIPTNYISIHLRLGDRYLETDKKFVFVKNDERKFSENKLYKFIEENINKNIIFFCDNKQKKLKIKEKYKNILITNSKIGHTSLSNTTSKQFIDSITEFYILTNSQLIYAASKSGFSKLASKFKNVEYIEFIE